MSKHYALRGSSTLAAGPSQVSRPIFTVQLAGAGSELPVILDSSGVNEPAAIYFRERQKKGDLPGTLGQSAYVLREFFDWLIARGIKWTAVRDEHLRDWLGPQNALQGIRLERKPFVVFDFYLCLQNRGYLTNAARVPSPIVGVGPEFPIQARIVQKQVWSKRGHRRETTSTLVPAAERPRSTAPRNPRRRRVPDLDEVLLLLEQLLESGDGFISTRRWFVAVFMARVGLRREGVKSLTVSSLEEALREAGIDVPELGEDERSNAGALGWSPRLSALSALAYSPTGQNHVLDQLLQYGQVHEFLPLNVVEKGRKQRTVLVPVDLVQATLRLWIWDHHARATAKLLRSRPGTNAPGALWLSSRSAQGMAGGSIGNEIKRGFGAIAGPRRSSLSGHRLRAYYLTNLIRQLYRKARATQGIMVDLNAILAQAAERAGHESPESLRPYLDREIMASLDLEGYAVLVQKRDHAALLRGIALRLADDGESLWASLSSLARQHGVDPIGEPETAFDADAALARHQLAAASHAAQQQHRDGPRSRP